MRKSQGDRIKDLEADKAHLMKMHAGDAKKRDKISKRVKTLEKKVEEQRTSLRTKTRSLALTRKEIHDLKELEKQRNRIQGALEKFEKAFPEIKCPSDALIPRVLAAFGFAEDRILKFEEQLVLAHKESEHWRTQVENENDSK